MHIISPTDPTMVRVKGPENVFSDFSGFRLAARKGSCKLSTTVKRQMGRSGVMTCSSVTLRTWNFMKQGKQLTLCRGCDSSKKENATMASTIYAIWFYDRTFFVDIRWPIGAKYISRNTQNVCWNTQDLSRKNAQNVF